jgi:hypothetical protein
MKRFLFGLFFVGCLNLITGCDLNFNDVPSTIISYDVGFYPCCDYYYVYKAKN